MKIWLIQIRARRAGLTAPLAELIGNYLLRAGRYTQCELRSFADEESLLAFCDTVSGRTRTSLLLTDSRGKQASSEEIAAMVRDLRDAGTQQLVVAVGPADGWSDAARRRADSTLSFGRITMPHELAALIAAEQIYRALTILAGHPYHTGH